VTRASHDGLYPPAPAPAYRFESSTTVKVVAWIVAMLSSLYMLRGDRNHAQPAQPRDGLWIDLLLGWTIVGWIILVMACRSKKPDDA
jgi:hypothetical protein